jgi:hypothetical protein
MLAAIGLAGPAEAAPAWSAASQLRLEARRPDFDSDEDVQLLSGTVLLSARLRMSENAVFLAEGTLTRLSLESDSEDVHSQTAFGNPYLGFEVRPSGSSLFVGGGLRLPVADEEKFYPLYYGIFSDLDRWEASVTHAITFDVTLGQRVRDGNGVGIEWRVVPTLWHPTQGEADEEIYLRAAGGLFAEGPNAHSRLSISARGHLTRDEGDFGERTLFAAELSGAVRAGAIWPGLVVQLPLDRDLREELNMVIGLSLTYAPEGPR